ncbi:MAG: ABC transporter ATP-binding protein [Bdellovibrionales bacterium]|nr:ABC transporter ATP-binding protein [Bdellovibrionales bacterium]
MSKESQGILEIQNLECRFYGRSILNGVNLSILRGESVGLIGPNGCGKTTLFNCLSGFLRPAAGSIQFLGKEITPLHPHQRARLGIGRVFQNFGVFREMTVGENLLMALEGSYSIRQLIFPSRKQSRQNSEYVQLLLEEVGLAEKENDKAGNLSGGQMRILEICRTIAFGAELFLLDEPTAGVSPKMKGELAQMIEHLKKLGKTIFIIEHDMNFIQQLCSRIVVLNEGVVALEGKAQEVRSSEVLKEIYFGKGGEAPSTPAPHSQL